MKKLLPGLAQLAFAIVMCSTSASVRLLHAQSSISLAPLGGYLWIDRLLDYDERFLGYYTDWHSREVLRFSNAPVFGARLQLTRGTNWFGYLESQYASTRLRYSYDTQVSAVNPSGPPGTTSLRRWDVAKINTYELGVGRYLGARGFRFDARLGGGIYQLRPKKNGGFCPVGVPCPLNDDRWKSSYNVPTLAGGLGFRTPAVWGIGLEVAGNASVGRIDWSGLAQKPPSNSFLYDPPAHRWVHTATAQLGISLGRN